MNRHEKTLIESANNAQCHKLVQDILNNFDDIPRIRRELRAQEEEFAEYQLRQQQEHWAHQNQDDDWIDRNG